MKRVKSLFVGQVALTTLFCLLLIPVHSIETSGDILVTSTCYRNAVGLSAPKIELVNMGTLQCRRQCAIRESCKACHVFTHSVIQNQVCHLYQDNICDNVTMYYNSNVTDGSIWEKISGNITNNVFTCRNDGNCDISPEIPTPTAPSFSIPTSANTFDAILVQTESFSIESTTNAGITLNNETSPPSLSTINSANPVTTQKPVETRPRTCWDYFVLNGTLDSGYGTPRPVWPSGFANGTNITVYCKQGYTAILINYAVLSGISYDNKNDVTVFGSLTQRIAKANTTAWNAYVSSINFPILSSLVRITNRTLYYENAGDFSDASCTFAGLDITPDGTLSVQGSPQTISGSPPPLSGLPVINSSFVNSTCGSFWKLPATSTNICNQDTNMLLSAESQKTGASYIPVLGTTQSFRRFVALAFK